MIPLCSLVGCGGSVPSSGWTSRSTEAGADVTGVAFGVNVVVAADTAGVGFGVHQDPSPSRSL